VLWDFDGTLAQRPGLWGGCAIEVLDEHEPGHGVTIDQIRLELSDRFPWHRHEVPHPELTDPADWWRHVEGIVADAMQRAGVAADRAPTLAQAMHERFVDPARGWALYDDTITALRASSAAGWRNVVLSNHVPELDQIVLHLGLGPHLELIVNSAVIGYEKPHPEAFRHALARCGNPAEAWMVGDNIAADVRGAESVGLPAILVRRPGDARHRADGLDGAVAIVLEGAA
jgi:putative hydrolase of the HAD superfamily